MAGFGKIDVRLIVSCITLRLATRFQVAYFNRTKNVKICPYACLSARLFGIVALWLALLSVAANISVTI